MNKNFFYTALGLMGIVGALSIGVVNASIYSVIRSNQPADITIIYNANGGTFNGGATTKQITYTKDANNLYVASGNVQAPNKSGKTCENNTKYCMFDGWYIDTSYATEWLGVPTDTDTTTKTVYAKWLPFEDLDLGFGGYTIMDRNLGASAVAQGLHKDDNGNNPENLSKIGKYYQWGNNYGFRNGVNGDTWPYTDENLVVNTTSTPWGPGNYYSSATFIKRSSNPYKWDGPKTTDNGVNLWGGTSQNEADKQGPCPAGYHIPSSTEWQSIYNAFTTWKSTTPEGTSFCNNYTTVSKCFAAKLKLPFAGFRASYNSSVRSQGDYGRYWSSTRQSEDVAMCLSFNSPNFYPNVIESRADGGSVRCLKDSPTQTLTFNASENGGETSAAIVPQKKGTSVTLSTSTYPASKANYSFVGWNTDKNATTALSSITLDEDKVVYSIFSKTLIGTYTAIHANIAENKTSDTCTMYNKETSCSITLPSISCNAGYHTPTWFPANLDNITSNTGATASCTPNDNTPYTVEHYFENVDGTGFDIDNTLTDNLTGTTDTHTGAEYKVVTGFTGSSVTSGAESSGNIAGNGSLTLKLYYIRNNYTLTFDSNSGSAVNPITAKYGSGITLPESTRTGYIFTGWKDENDVKFYSGDVYTLSGDTTLTGQWIAGTYVVTYDVNGGDALTPNTGTVTYDAVYGALPTPSRNGYSFNGWFTAATNGTKITATTVVSATGDHTLYAQWTQNPVSGGSSSGGGSSGGGGRNKAKTSSDSVKSTETQTGNSDEMQQAYEFAKEHWITTMPTIEEANMEGPLTRIAMAKMLSYYAINVLGQKPDETRINKFNDIPEELDKEYDSGVTLAYQLGIMGINMPNNKFRPNDEVTRAEFATALSRMIYHTSDGEYESTDKYYIHHMEKLVKEGIITKDDPNMKELRGYVMIMLMRSIK